MAFVSDSKINLRNAAMSVSEISEEKVIEAWIVNLMVIGKTDKEDGEIINGLDYLDTDYPLPKIKASTPAAVREFLNTQLTNEINRRFGAGIGKVRIESYESDREEIIEAAKDDKRFAKFISQIEEYNWDSRRTDFQNEVVEEDYDYLKVAGVKSVIYPTPVKIVFVDSKLIPKSPELDAGNPMRLTANRKLYKLYATDLNLVETIIFDDEDNSYILTESVYGYPTIKKDNLDSYFWLKIH